MTLSDILAALTATAVIVGAISWLAKAVIDKLLTAQLEAFKLKLNASLEEKKAALQAELMNTRIQLETQSSIDARIRAEIVRWANPILGSVETLKRRLDNILKNGGYQALSRGYSDASWSITYEYFLPSSLYVFASFFAWTHMLKDELNFELFRSHREKDAFFQAILTFQNALSMYPQSPECEGEDHQVFFLQQRAIGEALVVDTPRGRRCMSYADFLQRMDTEPLTTLLDPLRAVLDGLKPAAKCRWRRIEQAFLALSAVQSQCASLLNITKETPSAAGV